MMVSVLRYGKIDNIPHHQPSDSPRSLVVLRSALQQCKFPAIYEMYISQGRPFYLSALVGNFPHLYLCVNLTCVDLEGRKQKSVQGLARVLAATKLTSHCDT